MATLWKLCLFTHTRSFIMLLSAILFTFIFPFETQQCCAWTILGTSNMSCFTLLRLLNVCMWILVFMLFFGDWHMLCQRLKSCTPNICLQRGMGLLFLSCSFPMLFVWVCVVLFFVIVFLFSTCSFLAYCLGFWFFFVFINIFLQQSILSCSFPTLLGLHCLVVYCCFLVLYLLISFIVVWIFDFFVSLNIFFTTIHLFLEYGY